MTKKTVQRIMQKDMKAIVEQNLNDLGIYIEFNEENIMEAKAMIIGPQDSLYENSYLFFNIKFPNNYPYSPPDVSYVPRNRVRIHPNIYVGGHPKGGKVCLSILGTWSGPKWTSIMDIATVLLTIQSLLDKNPLHHEPGQENNHSHQNNIYNHIIEYNSIQSLILRNIQTIPPGFECFESIVKEHFETMKHKTFQKIKSFGWETKSSEECYFSFYRIKQLLDYKKTFQELKNLI
jgi:ubiquitin-protein ligase